MPSLTYNLDALDDLHENYIKMQRAFIERNDKAILDIDVLYHYTTAQGIQSILRDRSFWASDISYLNDSSELDYDLKLFQERLEDFALEVNSEWVKNFYYLLGIQTNELFKIHNRVYVVCFCTKGNLLSQWRGYGDGGGGYSIGLSATNDAGNMQTNVTPTQENRLFLRQVIYDPVEQNQLLNSVLSSFSSIIKNFDPAMVQTVLLDDAIKYVHKILADLLPCSKSNVFSEEQEWRYIYFPDLLSDEGIKFRIKNENFVPYIPLDLFKQSQRNMRISRIYCGPTLHPTQSLSVMDRLVPSLGHSNVEIISSGIPLRY